MLLPRGYRLLWHLCCRPWTSQLLEGSFCNFCRTLGWPKGCMMYDSMTRKNGMYLDQLISLRNRRQTCFSSFRAWAFSGDMKASLQVVLLRSSHFWCWAIGIAGHFWPKKRDPVDSNQGHPVKTCCNFQTLILKAIYQSCVGPVTWIVSSELYPFLDGQS